jgi:hypothetical protein
MANHIFNVGIATKYGVFKAIMIEQIYWWVHHNECEEDETMMHEGRFWCRASAKGFNKYLPYIEPQKIGRILRELEKEEKIKVGNFNTKATNQTKWYTFTDTFKKELEDAGYDFSKMKIGIFKNEKSNINSIINNPLNNIEDNIQEERKRLSNDNQKASDELFEKFWESYAYKRGKDKAIKAWKRLTKKEKEEAIKCVPVYKEDCLKNDRNMKYPSTYLNGKTWEDDFSSDGNLGEKQKTKLCYEPQPNDSEMVVRFKKWMREKHPEIEFTEVPLTFEGYMRLQDRYGQDEVLNQLDYIDANIGKFRQCDIEKSIIQYFQKA